MYDALARFIAAPARTAALLAAIFATAFATPLLIAADVPEPAVAIAKFAFAPKEITIAPGAKIRWTNRDEVPHTVTGSKDKTIKSAALDTGDTFEYTFTQEGDFEYYCSVHPFMTGVVHVRKQ
jgi:plastocyanin